MRNVFRYIFTVFLCLLAASAASRAQNDWDSVLDRYESITARCKELRDKAAAGEAVSQKAVTSLFAELNRLRNTLGQASGRMTKAQWERFRAIRESYDGESLRPAPGPAQGRAQKDTTVILSEAKDLAATRAKDLSATRAKDLSAAGAKEREILQSQGSSRMTDTLLPPLAPLTAPATLTAPAPLTAPATLTAPASMNVPAILSEAMDLSAAGAKDLKILQSRGFFRMTDAGKQLRFNAIPTLSLGDTHQGGIFLSVTKGRLGGYVSARSNFVSQRYAFDILSDGTSPGNALFEAGGGRRMGEFSAAAGVVGTVTPWLDLYAGAGFGSSTLCWNDSRGAWAKVRDYSGSGALLDGGVVFHIKRLSLLGGVSWLTARPEAGPFLPVFSLGAGILL